MSDLSACPCDSFVHPRPIFNPPGRDTIVYRVGDFTTFRHALLLSRPEETELAAWVPEATGDLAMQMVEWWAHLADVLTFYNERIANASYLQTALQGGNASTTVNRVIRGMGYRPRPGIAASGIVGALTNSTVALTLPAGLQIQSKPGPGKQPQVFELDAQTPITPILPAVVEPDPIQDLTAPVTDGGSGGNPAASNSAAGAPAATADGSVTVAPLLLKGVVTKARPGDQLLLLVKKQWDGTQPDVNPFHALLTVDKASPEKDPHGAQNTRVTFTAQTARLPAAPPVNTVKEFRLLKSARSAHVWQYHTGRHVVITDRQVDLEAITRDIKAGDPILFQIPSPESGTPAPQLIRVTSYSEQIWYANAPADDPSTPPDLTKVPPIPIPHTSLGFAPLPQGDFDAYKTTLEVRYAWQDVGEILPTPAPILDDNQNHLTAVGPAKLPPGDRQLLIQDAQGNGVLASAHVEAPTASSMQITYLTKPTPTLTPPLRAIFNLLSVSRGKTVTDEVLGSGNAGIAGQEFVLQNVPLTYLGAPELALGYRSTLKIHVDGVEWTEAPSFVGQSPRARIFATYEDDDHKTHIQFGDGINGARLPTGTNNIVASYRYGSGAEVPPPGALTAILQPQPGLKAIVSPVPMKGGADPDPPEKVRTYAVNSVLAFDRAVSLTDYETLAALAHGVARAQAYWTWDDDEEKMVVKVYVGDDDDAVRAAYLAISGVVDPNRPFVVRLATALPLRLKLIFQPDSGADFSRVVAAIRSTLVHPQSGLLGAGRIRPGQPLYLSEIHNSVLRLPGVQAIHELSIDRGAGGSSDLRYRHSPGEGKYFVLREEDLEVRIHAR